MLCLKRQIKIFSGSEKADVEKEYTDFLFSHSGLKNRTGGCRLGTLWNVAEPQCTYSEGKYVISLEFERFELKDGVSGDEYMKAYEAYDQYNLKDIKQP